MRVLNLPTDLLRTFVTVIEVQNFTRAADLLGRSQPAVSLQVKRLEELVGYKLIHQKGRNMQVSDKGEALAMHARQILRLNDQAVGLFDNRAGDDTLRIGLPLDYGVRELQRSLTALMKETPQTHLRVTCDLSQHLLDALIRDEIDIALALYQGGDPQFLVRYWQENPFWVGADGLSPGDFSDLPLVAHPTGCVYLQRMREALKRSRRGWEVVFSSPDIDAVQQAVRDGLGFSSLTALTLREGMRRIGEDEGLPVLEPLQIGLFYRQTRLRGSGNRVTECLIETIEKVLLSVPPAVE
ncbi:LysR family transcriptional regulator [Sulfitobacter aestuarii]|uniref:LysR family transcriptional regulator n=1 Tax=Sulfitobacter aestuarii TaxID=2161676 RepID=A0ABW5U4G4_9RHOB